MDQFVAEQKRASERHRTNFTVGITSPGKRHVGTVVDISTTGMCVVTTEPSTLMNGEKVEISCRVLAHIHGRVRWSRVNRVGIEIDRNSNTTAKINAFFKHFQRR